MAKMNWDYVLAVAEARGGIMVTRQQLMDLYVQHPAESDRKAVIDGGAILMDLVVRMSDKIDGLTIPEGWSLVEIRKPVMGQYRIEIARDDGPIVANDDDPMRGLERVIATARGRGDMPEEILRVEEKINELLAIFRDL
jgi:hypothetical protein